MKKTKDTGLLSNKDKLLVIDRCRAIIEFGKDQDTPLIHAYALCGIIPRAAKMLHEAEQITYLKDQPLGLPDAFWFIPELENYRPRGAKDSDYWWPHNDYQARLDVLDRLEHTIRRQILYPHTCHDCRCHDDERTLAGYPLYTFFGLIKTKTVKLCMPCFLKRNS